MEIYRLNCSLFFSRRSKGMVTRNRSKSLALLILSIINKTNKYNCHRPVWWPGKSNKARDFGLWSGCLKWARRFESSVQYRKFLMLAYLTKLSEKAYIWGVISHTLVHNFQASYLVAQKASGAREGMIEISFRETLDLHNTFVKRGVGLLISCTRL